MLLFFYLPVRVTTAMTPFPSGPPPLAWMTCVPQNKVCLRCDSALYVSSDIDNGVFITGILSPVREREIPEVTAMEHVKTITVVIRIEQQHGFCLSVYFSIFDLDILSSSLTSQHAFIHHALPGQQGGITGQEKPLGWNHNTVSWYQLL